MAATIPAETQPLRVATPEFASLPDSVWAALFEFHRSLGLAHGALCQAHRLASLARHLAGYEAQDHPSPDAIRDAAWTVGALSGDVYRAIRSIEQVVPMCPPRPEPPAAAAQEGC